MKSVIVIVALFGACVLSASGANIPQKDDVTPESSVARGGWGSASEIISGPAALVFAPVIAIGMILLLWVAAYNTLRSAPPKIGFGGGAQGGGGWGGNQGGVQVAGGWPSPQGGWAAGSEQHETAVAASSPQAATVANAVEQTVASTGQRSLNDLTRRVLRGIERGERAQRLP